MQRVIGLVRKTLNDTILAIDGQIIMTPDILDAINAIFDAKVILLYSNSSFNLFIIKRYQILGCMILLVLKFHGFFRPLVLGVDLLWIEISNLMIGYVADRDHFPTGYQDSLILKVSSLV
jgi:hypothetical protein